jgi:hypothetical protein
VAYDIARGYTRRIDAPQNQARLFVSGSSQYMESSTVPVLDQPFTWSVWFRKSVAATDGLMAMAATVFNHRFTLLTVFDGTIIFVIRAGAAPTEGVATTTTTYSANVWNHVVCVARGVNDRSVLLNAAGEGTDATNTNPNDMEAIAIGAQLTAVGSRTQFFSGDIFMPAVWSAALTRSEIYDIYRGKLPWFVRPSSIEACWDANGHNLVNNRFSLTAFNSPGWAGGYPNIRNIQMQPYGFVAAAPVGQPMMLRSTTIPHTRQWQPRGLRG